jgi:REP element-mobilizing transposase RayT
MGSRRQLSLFPRAATSRRLRGRIPHRRRPAIDGHYPVHVTVRLRDGLPNLRRRDVYKVLRDCFRAGRDRFHFRLAHYSVQHHHVHLICEAPTAQALGRGMQGLNIRIAKGINRARRGKGTVLRERYHLHELRTLRETRHTVRYVASNDRHHGSDRAPGFDTCSSFYFWRDDKRLFRGEEAPVMAPLTAHLQAALRLDLHIHRSAPTPASG